MSPFELPKVGAISNALHDFYWEYSNLSGKRLLCIGFSEPEIVQYVARHGSSDIVMLTNWADHADAKVTRFPLVLGDITRRTEFESDSFDAILTLSVLEHLSDLPAAFNEMMRLVRDGGEMLHMFGPAWSCAYGHHLYADATDPQLNFSLWSMPAHMHLLCSHDEIRDYYRECGYSDAQVQSVLCWFYETDIINRLPYDEYVRVMADERLQIDRMHLMYNDLPQDHLRRLRERHPGLRDFSTYGGRYRLIVRK